MDIETKLQVFHVLQIVCGVLAVALLILTVFIFIKMGIWQAILERSGVAKRKSILQLQEINALTGRLHKSSAARVAEQEFTGQFTSDKKKKTKRTGEFQVAPVSSQKKEDGVSEQSEGSQSSQETTVLDATPKYKFILTVDQRFIHTDEQIQGVS